MTPSVPGEFDAQRSAALAALGDAGTVWAATGRGQPLVDAAAEALASGVDSPALRVLAGAPARFADEEATELAGDVFAELGLPLAEKFSDAAYVALARLNARRFLDGDMSARELTDVLWGLYAACEFSPILAGASGLGDWYTLLDDGVNPPDEAAVDAQVRECAEELVAGEVPRDRHYYNRHR